MEPLLERLAKQLGIDKELARVAVGHVFAFLLKRHPDGAAKELVENFPGAAEAVALAEAAPRRGLRGLIGKVGEMIGGSTGDVVALTTRLTGMGFSPVQLQQLTRQTFGAAESVIGREKLQTMTDEIPGLSKFLWPQRA